MIGSYDPAKMMHGTRAHGPDLMSRFTHLFGDTIVRFLLDVSHDERLAGRLLQLAERIEGIPELLRMDHLRQRQLVVRSLPADMLESQCGALVAAPPVEGQIDRGPAGVSPPVDGLLKASRMTEFYEQILHQFLGHVLAQRQPRQQREQLRSRRIQQF